VLPTLLKPVLLKMLAAENVHYSAENVHYSAETCLSSVSTFLQNSQYCTPTLLKMLPTLLKVLPTLLKVLPTLLKPVLLKMLAAENAPCVQYNFSRIPATSSSPNRDVTLYY